MTRDERERADERVEMIAVDPDVFASGSPDASTPAAPRRRPALVALGSLLVVAIAVVSSRGSGSSSEAGEGTTPTTSMIPTSMITAVPIETVVAPPSTVPGRAAPASVSSLGFLLRVEPSSVALGTPVTMQLVGDLTGVSSPIVAVAWVDERVSGAWRTTHWMARAPGPAQTGGVVSPDPFGPGPDAVTFDAAQAVQFSVDVLAPGSYRVCRYVPLRSGGAPTLAANPVYVCAPLIVDRARRDDDEGTNDDTDARDTDDDTHGTAAPG